MTNLEDALIAVDAGADAVGFVFYEKSPRNIRVDHAREIVEKLPEGVEKVGVFVNETRERVSAIVDQAGLTSVQFHGNEYLKSEMLVFDQKSLLCIPARWAALTWRKEGKAFGSFIARPKNLRAIMLDSSTEKQHGGTGKRFNWREAGAWVPLLSQLHPIAIAGGLTPQNVGEAMTILKPWGVDVVSGVELRSRKKDAEKVRAFVKAVREIDRKTS
jgi:phosphoribosylanthranilate isomerase